MGRYKIFNISKTVDLLVEFGFNGENLTSQNAVIPIVYYFMKGGSDDIDSKDNIIRKYLIHALLKQIYGGQGDRVLTNIRDALREKDQDSEDEYHLRQNRFSFEDLIENVKLPPTKSLEITDEDIKEILECKKGPYTFMVLSLLYPNLRFGQVKFHQDHIHPASLFTDAKLRKHEIPQDKWKKWQEMKDMLPNLQLMEGSENESKNKTPFKQWLDNTYQNNDSKNKFMENNDIPNDVSLELKDFEMFYEKRKEILRDKLKKGITMKMATAYNKRVYGSGFQPSPKSPSVTSDIHWLLTEITQEKIKNLCIIHIINKGVNLIRGLK